MLIFAWASLTLPLICRSIVNQISFSSGNTISVVWRQVLSLAPLEQVVLAYCFECSLGMRQCAECHTFPQLLLPQITQ